MVFRNCPETIKLAPVIKSLQQHSKGIEISVIRQHLDVRTQVQEDFKVKRNFDLNLMTTPQCLTDILNSVLKSMCNVYNNYKDGFVQAYRETPTIKAEYFIRTPIGCVQVNSQNLKLSEPYFQELNQKRTSNSSKFYFTLTGNW